MLPINRHTLLTVFLSLIFSGYSLAQTTNIALHKPVIANTEAISGMAKYLVDGKISRQSQWQAKKQRAPHIIEIDLQKYYEVSQIKVHSGLLEEEKKVSERSQSPGFWSIKNFKLQYWDDANWNDFPDSERLENRLVSNRFFYQPAITTFKVRLLCDDGEAISIMEIEVLGKEAKHLSAPEKTNLPIFKQANTRHGQPLNITVFDSIVGKTMKYVGYNQGYYFPGSNVSGWLEYAQVNSLRVWTSLNAFVPEKAVQVDTTIHSLEEFERRKAILRRQPENNPYIQWASLYPLYDRVDASSTNAMVLNYVFKELNRLKIDMVLQIGSTDFTTEWHNKWKQWQRYYALVYYAAKNGNVEMFALQNEPNHRHSGPMKLNQWIGAMQIVSDAIQSAIADVNKQYYKKLIGKLVGPVTAGQNTDWWAGIARAIRTNYKNETTPEDLLQLFSTHSYNAPAVGYQNRVNNIRNIISTNHPAGKSLPILYTEIGRWMNAYLIDKEETMDSPSLFTEWAGIYTQNMQNQAYGMWAFKLANTVSSTYSRGIKSGHHFTWQGKRIVTAGFTNLALNQPTRTSHGSGPATVITDGNHSNTSAWVSDSTEQEKWIEIDLGKTYTLGATLIYTGSDGGVYTAPDRIKNFKLQFRNSKGWQQIPGASFSNNKYAQIYQPFTQPVEARFVRMLMTDSGRLKVRDIQLFQAGDGPDNSSNYNISGIQRAGQVVRLFAKGFKDERPLLFTSALQPNTGVDHCTSYDEKTGNYYMWLVQRDSFGFQVQIDVSRLAIDNQTPILGELIDARHFGAVKDIYRLNTSGILSLPLPAQSVLLLTIPKRPLKQSVMAASHWTTVNQSLPHQPSQRQDKQPLEISLHPRILKENKVAYIHFDTDQINWSQTSPVLLKINGYTNKKGAPFRFHVYAIPGGTTSAQSYSWKNAPLLNQKAPWIEEVGTKAFIAGELALTEKPTTHYLDITSLVKNHPGKALRFALIRETRHLGDDEDIEVTGFVETQSRDLAPQLMYWQP